MWSGLLLLALCLWPWRRSQKNKTSFEDIGVLSLAGLTKTGTSPIVYGRQLRLRPTLAPFDGLAVYSIFYYYFSYRAYQIGRAHV